MEHNHKLILIVPDSMALVDIALADGDIFLKLCAKPWQLVVHRDMQEAGMVSQM